MIDGGIADDIVEDDVHATFVSLLKEPPGIVVGAVAWSYLVIVAYVVTSIMEGRVEEGIEPDGIHSKAFHVVELADDALQVADAVTVGVAKSLWIDLVKHRILRPVRHFRYFILTSNRLCRQAQHDSHCQEAGSQLSHHSLCLGS